MNQTGLEWVSAIVASRSWKWGGRDVRMTPPESATLAVLMRRAYIQYT
jgi:hypothetical protein